MSENGILVKAQKALEESFDALIKIKDSYWPIKKGEGFERATRPLTREEALSQSWMETEKAIIVSVLPGIDEDINFFCGTTDKSLTVLSEDLARSFGSRKGKRMELTFDAIKSSQEVPNMSTQMFRSNTPYGQEDRNNRLKGEPDY